MILGVAFGLMGAFFTAGMYVAGALGCLSLIIKAGVMPNGAIVLKENYTPEENLAATTVMYKKTGYNPDHNDWYWLKVLAPMAPWTKRAWLWAAKSATATSRTTTTSGPARWSRASP